MQVHSNGCTNTLMYVHIAENCHKKMFSQTSLIGAHLKNILPKQCALAQYLPIQ